MKETTLKNTTKNPSPSEDIERGQKLALRQNAIFIPTKNVVEKSQNSQAYTFDFVANMANLGFGLSETLLQRLFTTSEDFQLATYDYFAETLGINKNWTPLVKGWDTPTGETWANHFITLLTNVFGGSGTKMPCGHVIPKGTFPLERYNGCPFCGTPFEFEKLTLQKQGSNQKVLDLWTETQMQTFFKSLLISKTALDATQMDSLKTLLAVYNLPKEVEIPMKETVIAVIDSLVEKGKADKAQAFFQSPTDILRYLWYKHTGNLQIVEPQTIIRRSAKNTQTFLKKEDKKIVAEKTAALKLKYGRKEAIVIAKWLNDLPLSAEKACEIMHPKRGIWVRMIRALRLAEFSKRKGFERLATLMDVFYNQKYEVFEGRVAAYKLRLDETKTLELLSQRPGLFARSLFATMLWFDYKTVVAAFAKVADKVPARLIFTLNMYAQNYFDPTGGRTIKGLGGVSKFIPKNPLLKNYTASQLDEMKAAMEDLCLQTVMNRFEKIKNPNKTIYIDPALYKMPVAIGDRSETVQDLPSALMGTRFGVEGNAVRLFMQWGTGLPAGHLDMDLSCHLAFKDGQTSICSYSNLVTIGCKHSGDIQYIPENVGTAEYIEINVSELQKSDVQYVTFTCNAYSSGALSPNLVVGWMNTAYNMTISPTSGVAYDPSCVQHQVRITQGLTKGLVFGVLDVAAREIIWFEMPFHGQVVQQLDTRGITALISKLSAKLTVGNLLSIKALAQNLELNETPESDEIYTIEWARNAAAVTQLLLD